MSIFNAFHVAGSAMTAQAMRLNAVASNLANADSVVSSDGQPYRAKQVVFAATPMGNPAAQGVRVTQVVEDRSPGRLLYDPRNPAADAQGYVTMPNVSVVDEMTNMISAARAYQTNAEVMNTAKQLLLRTLALGQ
ncbi:MAG: flagellar basal body rod protein FlgC [Candidatus Accumulibacter sp.]|uniref:flagellar basal body rod protein FlgC n=1 Tax=Accumulibacter sp. TaxID=2053492 RepID=UPI0019E1CCA4|nr:flagellar basal body rod protein FlgC [Accumulibacter sp.]MBE2258472.1 flagellar basal body rod protein FlgC [Paracoccaceae bacterium]MCB1941505.1 flagellar basal body rod protein FlgC [Accumulibacter sp.]MCP5249178.1 flagellar basal body rod protein FlgC [Accumulibacter sp.]